jgi:hypothetical protein
VEIGSSSEWYVKVCGVYYEFGDLQIVVVESVQK